MEIFETRRDNIEGEITQKQLFKGQNLEILKSQSNYSILNTFFLRQKNKANVELLNLRLKCE